MTLSWECVAGWSDLQTCHRCGSSFLQNLEQVNNHSVTSTVLFYVDGAPFQPGLVQYEAPRASVSVYEIRGLDKMMAFVYSQTSLALR